MYFYLKCQCLPDAFRSSVLVPIYLIGSFFLPYFDIHKILPFSWLYFMIIFSSNNLCQGFVFFNVIV